MADTAALVVALSAQLTKFEKDMNDAGRIADRGAKRIEDAFNKINPTFEGIKHGLEAIVGGLGLAEIISQLQDLTKEVVKIGEAAENLGVGVEEFQRLRFAVVAAGADIDKAEGFLTRFSRSVSEAGQGQGELVEWFRRNNVAIKDQTGELLPLTQLLSKFADLVQGTTSAQNKLNLVMAAGGRDAGPALLSLFQDGSAGLQKFMDEATKTGEVIDKELVEKVKRAAIENNKAWLNMKTGASEFAALLTTEVAGGFRALGEVVKEVSIAIEAFFSTKPISQFSQTFNEVARQRGIEALKAGQGTPTIQSLAGFPGQPKAESGPTKVTVVPDAAVKSFENLLEAQKRRRELLDAESITIGKTAGETERLKTQIELESRARQQNIELTPARIAAIGAEADAMGKAAQKLFEFRQQWVGLNAAAQFAGNQLVDVIEQATQKSKTFGEIMTGVLRSVTHEILQAAITGQGAFATLLGTATKSPGGTGGLLGALISNIPKFAGGGVSSGGLAIVGENGPELVSLSAGTRVIPGDAVQRQTGAGGDMNVNVAVDLAGANGDLAIERAVNRGVQRAVQQSVSIVNSTAPGRSLRFSQLGT
jgi:hypothetical protein